MGDVRFKDLNNDKKLNADDQNFIGNPIPKFSFGLNTNLSYQTNAGTLDFSMIWQGSYGNDIYNNTRYYGEGMFGYTNCFASTKNRYRAEELSFVNPVSGITTIYPQNTNTNMPRAILGDPNQNTRKSDRYVEDGSYLRLKSLTLSYTLPTNLVKKLNIEKLKFFVGGKNLLTFKDILALIQKWEIKIQETILHEVLMHLRHGDLLFLILENIIWDLNLYFNN